MSETNLFSEGFSIGWGVVSQIEIVDELFSILDCAFLLGRQGSQVIDSDCQFDTHIPTFDDIKAYPKLQFDLDRIQRFVNCDSIRSSNVLKVQNVILTLYHIM